MLLSLHLLFLFIVHVSFHMVYHNQHSTHGNNIIENNRNELKRLFNNKFLSDFIDDAEFHEFENEYGETVRTGYVPTEYTEG